MGGHPVKYVMTIITNAITIAIITIAIIIISPGLNTDTYGYKRWEARSRCPCKI